MKLNLIYKCEICGLNDLNKRGLGTHLQFKHSDISKEIYYKKYLKCINEDICKVCGKPTKFLSFKLGFANCCSKECSRKWNNKRIQDSNLDKFGVKTPFELKEIQEKVKNTIKEKYNCNNIFQVSEIKEKIKRTLKEKYNVEYPLECEFFKNKAKETTFLRYGNENYRNPLKAEETCLKNNGVKHPAQSGIIAKKTRGKYIYNNIIFDSSWELAYYIWLKDHNINFEYHTIKLEYEFNNNLYYYFPDFLVENDLIEIKGDQFLSETGNLMSPYKNTNNEKLLKKFECMKNNNVKIISSTEIRPIILYIKDKYGKDFLNRFKGE